MSLLTYPKFSAQDAIGVNLSGGLVYFYEAGTSTPKDTYSDSSFTVANTNPVVLNSRGEADIYLNGTYKIVLKDASDAEIWTQDNFEITPTSQWETSIPSTFSTTTAFKVVDDLTADYEEGRRIKLNDASVLYGTITSSTYFSPDTTVNVSLDSGVLSSSLTDTELSVLTTSNSSIPNGLIGSDVSSAAALVLGEGDYFDVTGTTTITSITSRGKGKHITLQFDSALILTHHATDLILPGAANITTAAGDIGVFYEYAAGDWQCVSYSLASGRSLVSSLIASGVAIATTSGTSHDFTGIPSWVKKITLSFSGVSTSGISEKLVQIGDSGGIETTGYVGTSARMTASVLTGNYTTGVGIRSIAAIDVVCGILTLSLLDAATNTWSMSGVFGTDTAIAIISNGTKSLSDTQTQLRLTTVNGTDTFDAGSINILYE
jgi:hypothetical protein